MSLQAMAASAFARVTTAILTLKGHVDALANPALNVYDQWESANFSVNAAAVPPFAGTAISSGTTSTAIPAAAVTGRNWGGAFMRSSTTANGGYRYQTSSLVSMFFGQKSAKGQALWRHRTQFTGVTVRYGYHDSSTSADAVDGAYFEVNGATVSAKTANNSVRTTHGTTYTLSLDVDYLFDIEVNAAATEARFRVYLADTPATAVMDVTITTNIPTTSARVFGYGLVATESSTTALDMIILYFMGFGTVAGYEASRRSKVGPAGPAGLSAYQLALTADPPFVGTLEEWLESLNPTAETVDIRLTAAELLWTHDLIVATVAGPRVTSLAALATFYGLAVPDTIPGTFGPSDWDAAATAVPGEMTINPSTLPSDGGDALTAIQYRVNGGTVYTLSGTGTGPRTVTAGFTAGVPGDIQIRAVNTVSADPANWSAVKTRTPAAAGGAALVITDVTIDETYGTSVPVTIPTVAAGNSLIIATRNNNPTTSITGATEVSAGVTHGGDHVHFFKLENAVGLASVTIVTPIDTATAYAVLEVDALALALASTLTDDVGTGTDIDQPFTTTQPNATAVAMLYFSNGVVVTPDAGWTAAATPSLYDAVVHMANAGAAGGKTASVTLADTRGWGAVVQAFIRA